MTNTSQRKTTPCPNDSNPKTSSPPSPQAAGASPAPNQTAPPGTNPSSASSSKTADTPNKSHSPTPPTRNPSKTAGQTPWDTSKLPIHRLFKACPAVPNNCPNTKPQVTPPKPHLGHSTLSQTDKTAGQSTCPTVPPTGRTSVGQSTPSPGGQPSNTPTNNTHDNQHTTNQTTSTRHPSDMSSNGRKSRQEQSRTGDNPPNRLCITCATPVSPRNRRSQRCALSHNAHYVKLGPELAATPHPATAAVGPYKTTRGASRGESTPTPSQRHSGHERHLRADVWRALAPASSSPRPLVSHLTRHVPSHPARNGCISHRRFSAGVLARTRLYRGL